MSATEVILPCHFASRITRHLARAQAVTTSPFTFSTQVQDWGGARWVYDFDFDVRREDARALDAAINRIGTGGTFLWTEQTQVRKTPPRLYMTEDCAAGTETFVASAGLYRALDALTQLDNVPAGAVESGDHLTLPTSDKNIFTIPSQISDAWRGRIVRVMMRARQTTSEIPQASQVNLQYAAQGEWSTGDLGDFSLTSDWQWLNFDVTVPLELNNGQDDYIRLREGSGGVSGEFFDISHIAAVAVNEIGLLSPGDFISVGSGASTRLHQLVEAIGLVGVEGVANELTINPPLRGAASRFDPLEVAAPRVLLRPVSPVPARVSPAQIYRFSMQAVEAL